MLVDPRAYKFLSAMTSQYTKKFNYAFEQVTKQANEASMAAQNAMKLNQIQEDNHNNEKQDNQRENARDRGGILTKPESNRASHLTINTRAAARVRFNSAAGSISPQSADMEADDDSYVYQRARAADKSYSHSSSSSSSSRPIHDLMSPRTPMLSTQSSFNNNSNSNMSPMEDVQAAPTAKNIESKYFELNNPQIHVLDASSGGISMKKLLDTFGIKGVDRTVLPSATHAVTMILDQALTNGAKLSKKIDYMFQGVHR